MKKLLLVVLLSVLILTGCIEKTKEIDYSDYSFVGVTWERENDHDTETIRFNADGSFSYSCACGNPVNDADLCEIYTYDEKTKEIKLDCLETTEETITTIKIINETNETLELDFDGDIRVFNKNN